MVRDPTAVEMEAVEERVAFVNHCIRRLWEAESEELEPGDEADMLPEISVGRLPAATPDELRTLVGKIKDYESHAATWRSRVASTE